MPLPRDIERKVGRLTSDELTVEDLHDILLWIRFRTLGRAPLVRDLGDLIAHRHDKSQGTFWQTAVDFINMATWQLIKSRKGTQPSLDMIERVCMGSLRAMGAHQTRQIMRLGFTDAKAALKGALKKVDGIEGWTVFTKEDLTKSEVEILEQCLSVVRAPHPFTEEELLSQFNTALAINGASLEWSDADQVLVGKRLSKLFVRLASGTRILNEDKSPAGFLQFMMYDDEVRIGAVGGDEKIMIQSAIYATTLTLADFSATEGIDDPKRSDINVEIGRDWRLNVVR